MLTGGLLQLAWGTLQDGRSNLLKYVIPLGGLWGPQRARSHVACCLLPQALFFLGHGLPEPSLLCSCGPRVCLVEH